MSERSERIEPTYEQIEQRAYELFLERGCEHGGDAEDWLAAEQELRELATEDVRRIGKKAAAQNDTRADTDEQTEASAATPRKKATSVHASVSSAS
jgi:hypothetical protein